MAKLAAAAVDRNSIIIAGGIYGDSDLQYQYVNSVYRLDLGNQPKWVKLAKMLTKRTLYSTLPGVQIS